MYLLNKKERTDCSMKMSSKLLFVPLVSLLAFTAFNSTEKAMYAASETGLTAYIGKDNPIILNDTSSNQVVSDTWGVNDIKNLHLDVEFSEADVSGKYIEVKLPVGMKLNSSMDSFVNGTTILSVDKSQFGKEQIKSNNADIYVPDCGTFKFNIANGVKLISLDIWVSVDENFWDTTDGATATSPSKNAIEVSAGSSTNKTSKKLNDVYITGRYWDTYYDSNMPAYVQVDDKITVSNELTMDYVQNKFTRLYKKVTSKMEIPYVIKTVNGVATKQYATVVGVEVHEGGKWEIVNNQIIITYENMWLKNANYDVYVNFNSSIFKENDVVTFNYGDLYVENYFSGKSNKLLGMVNKTVYVGPKGEKVLISADTVGAYNMKNESVINHFGRFAIGNYGGLSSSKRLTFDFPNGSSSGVGVTTIRIPTNEAPETLQVNYVLWQKGTNATYSGVIPIDKPRTSYYSGHLLTVSDIKAYRGISNVKDLYFKQVKYVMGRIPYDYVSGIRSSELSPLSSGNIWGVVFQNTAPETYYSSTMTVESLSTTGAVTSKDSTYQNVIIKGTGSAPAFVEKLNYYDMNNNPIKEISSGNKIKIMGNVSMAPYPYTNSGYMNDPIIMVKLPGGITIDKANTSFTSSLNTSKKLTFQILNESSPRKLSNGESVYDIAILNQGFGNFSERLDILNTINFEITIDISKKVEPVSLNARGLVFVEDKYIKAQAYGSYDSWYIKDTLDANGNKATDDKLATVRYDDFLIVNSNTNWLDTDISISVNNGSYTKDNIQLVSSEDAIKFKLSINNIHDGYVPAGGLLYNITVPKNDMSGFGYSLELTSYIDAPIDFFDITYTEDGTNYVAKGLISDIRKVRGIRIKSIKQIDPNYIRDFIVNMRFEKNSYNKKSLFVNIMVNGSQIYRKGTSSNSIYHKLDPIYVFIKDNKAKPIITNPKQEGFIDKREQINIKWEYLDNTEVVASMVNIKDSSNKNVEILDIENSSSVCRISLSAPGIYSVTVTSYNAFGVGCSSDAVNFRYGVYNSDGVVYSKDISVASKITYIAILADKEIPKNTSITARVYYKTNSTGNVSITSDSDGYIEAPLQKLSTIKPISVKIPKAVSKVKVAFYFKNSTKPLDPNITPYLDYISVLAR